MKRIVNIEKIKSKPDYKIYTTDAATHPDCREQLTVYEIHRHFLTQYAMETDKLFPETLLETLQEKTRFRRAWERACYLLDARDYSYAMLYQKLMLSYQDASLCTAVMQKLVDAGAIDDRRYAQKYAEYLVQRKGYGIYRARQEMYRKGLDKDLIAVCLEEQADFAQEHISAVLARKYGRLLTDAQDRKAREKVIAGMARLGYDIHAIQEAIADYFAEQTEEENPWQSK